jgi:hypothetical protein
MSENNEPDATKRHVSTPNPAVEGEGGQYVAGDYGEAGTVDAGAASKPSGEYAEGDYGEAGTVDAVAASRPSGEYAEGDYGEAGTVDTGAASKPSGEYGEGDYGEAGTQPQSGPAAGQSNDSPEEQDQE